MHIFGEEHTVTHAWPRSIFGCTVCTNATSLVTPLAPPSYLLIPRLCCITHSVWEHPRGSSRWLHCSHKEEVQGWYMCPDSWPSHYPQQTAQMCDTLLFWECENRLPHTLWEIWDISAIFFFLWLLHKQPDSASFIFSLKGKNPETDFVFWHF